MNKDQLLKELSEKLETCEIQSETVNTGHPFKIGQAYLFRLVTHYWIGVVQAVTDQEIVLKSNSWIPDTGRFHEAVGKGLKEASGSPECEPAPDGVIIGRGALIDATPWNHKLPDGVL